MLVMPGQQFIACILWMGRLRAMQINSCLHAVLLSLETPGHRGRIGSCAPAQLLSRLASGRRSVKHGHKESWHISSDAKDVLGVIPL